MPELSHIREDGTAAMVDVSEKPVVRRDRFSQVFCIYPAGCIYGQPGDLYTQTFQEAAGFDYGRVLDAGRDDMGIWGLVSEKHTL